MLRKRVPRAGLGRREPSSSSSPPGNPPTGYQIATGMPCIAAGQPSGQGGKVSLRWFGLLLPLPEEEYCPPQPRYSQSHQDPHPEGHSTPLAATGYLDAIAAAHLAGETLAVDGLH